MDTCSRYPGAQPFPDTDVSRRTFFGRQQISAALTDQILANRLVIVYAKSGVGKTSLLNAGVAPRLREAGCIPLLVRVNDTQRSPLISVLESIRTEAERQQIEYVPGLSSSLWLFFRSVEFWREDLLLTPILIIDQFEELFTVQSDQARETFLAELGPLVRGVPPLSLSPNDSGNNAAPAVRVILCLREDFLGLLEEAADHIPEIMDHRFRLTALSLESAEQAITCPAAVADPNLLTEPFTLDPELVTAILNHLTNSTDGERSSKRRYVEPFHLQLICRRIEQCAERKQRTSVGKTVVGLEDFGGEPALRQTLADFYADAINLVPERHLRPAVRRLCEQLLISPEGRRLSQEERELQRQVGLPHATLRGLVESRLLRTDRRSESTYYELSHDALVEPVLANRRTQELLMSWAELFGGAAVSLVMGGFALGVVLLEVVLSISKRNSAEMMGGAAMILFITATSAWFGGQLLRLGIRKRKRYRRHFVEAPLILSLKDKLIAWAMLGAGSALLAFWTVAVLEKILWLHLYFHGSKVFTSFHDTVGMSTLVLYLQAAKDRPLLEIGFATIDLSACILFSWMILRQGLRRLSPHEALTNVALNRPSSSVSGVFKISCGIVAFGAEALGMFVFRQCRYVLQGRLPNWLPTALVPYAITSDCRDLYQGGWRNLARDSDDYFFWLALFIFSIALVCSGVRDLRDELRRRRLFH